MSAPTPRITSRFPEFLRDFGIEAHSRLESRWITVNGLLLHSRCSTSPSTNRLPFVLVHGLVISSLYMIPLAECLAEQDEVHALDLPGFGRSHSPDKVLSIPELADWLIAWMSAAGLQRCHLVANSMGCQIVAHVAVTAPDRVASLTLIGPTVDPNAFSVITQTLHLLHDAMHEPPRLWMNWLLDFCKAGIRRSMGTTRAMFRDHIERQLPQISAPTLIMRGGTDPTLPSSSARLMTELLAHGKFLELPGEPHCVHYTDPSSVCRAIRSHADSFSHEG